VRIGLLTAGGDCPGLNAVIRGVVARARQHGADVVGILEGWDGLMEGRFRPLDRDAVRGILQRGGTILGTSRRDPYVHGDGAASVRGAIEGERLDGLIVVGGDGTLRSSLALWEEGIPLVGVPKTIDNDIPGTDVTFGFDTAMQIATEAIDRITTTAESHDRVMVVEVMGRNAGWIALYGGLAGGADGIVIPEVDTTCEELAAAVTQRHDRGKDFSIIVVAEGANLAFASGEVRHVRVNEETDEYGYERLGGIGAALSKELERMTGYEARNVVLGHIQRGGSPTAHDRVLATRYGARAYELAAAGEFGRMVALHGSEITSVPLSEVRGIKTVDLELLEVAKRFFA